MEVEKLETRCDITVGDRMMKEGGKFLMRKGVSLGGSVTGGGGEICKEEGCIFRK